MSLMGFPVSNLFLYFILYSFLGWVMETCYCALIRKKWTIDTRSAKQ